jgi:hypothetical protein
MRSHHYENPNNPNCIAAGISGSVCVNHLWPVVAGGGVMTVRIITDSNGRKHITNEPLLHRPAPVQSCYCPNCEAMGKELAALKTQPAPVQEPVVCHICGGSGFIEFDEREKNNGKWGRCLNCQPYPTPPAQPAPAPGYCKHCKQYSIEEPLPAAHRQWVGLTDEEVYPLANEHLHYQTEGYEVSGIYDLARAIEAKLKEKNT